MKVNVDSSQTTTPRRTNNLLVN